MTDKMREYVPLGKQSSRIENANYTGLSNWRVHNALLEKVTSFSSRSKRVTRDGFRAIFEDDVGDLRLHQLPSCHLAGTDDSPRCATSSRNLATRSLMEVCMAAIKIAIPLQKAARSLVGIFILD